MTPEEVAAVMAEHEEHRGGLNANCLLRGHGIVRNEHCLSYRLAEALAEVNAEHADSILAGQNLARRLNAAEDALAASEAKVLRVGLLAGSWRMGLRDRIDADDISAALADQPEQAANYRRSVDA